MGANEILPIPKEKGLEGVGGVGYRKRFSHAEGVCVGGGGGGATRFEVVLTGGLEIPAILK